MHQGEFPLLLAMPQNGQPIKMRMAFFSVTWCFESKKRLSNVVKTRQKLALKGRPQLGNSIVKDKSGWHTNLLQNIAEI